MMQSSTIDDSVRMGSRALAAHSDSPRLDAELLLCTVLDVSRPGLWARASDVIAPHSRNAYALLIERRLRGEPVAYLTGVREFWSLSLKVTPAVLVPRPETELLVERALARIPTAGVCRVLDLGTGSGALALALSSERPAARITATDVSPAALAVAMRNARELGFDAIDWRSGSWFEPIPGERFDVIVSNPPYVAAGDPALDRLGAEPALALSPGPSGLEALGAIIAGAASHMNPRGALLVEHGSDQAPDVAGLLACHDFTDIETHADLSGRARVTVATLISPH